MGIYKVCKYVLLVTVMILCGIIYFFVAGKLTHIRQEHRHEVVRNHYSITTMLEQMTDLKYDYNKEPILVRYLYMEENIVFDEKLYKKFLRSYFSNSMLFAIFLALIKSNLFDLLRSIRRRYFEETHFKYIRILMKYIHRSDGEGEPILRTISCSCLSG